MKTTPNMVLFWHTNEIYSNWHPARFTAEDGVQFALSEQSMMWAKATIMGDHAMAARMLSVTSGGKLKAMGRDVQNYREDLWVQHRLVVMVPCVLASLRFLRRSL